MRAAAARPSRRWHCAPGSRAVALHRPRNRSCAPDLVGSCSHSPLANLFRAEKPERRKFKGRSAAMRYPLKAFPHSGDAPIPPSSSLPSTGPTPRSTLCLMTDDSAITSAQTGTPQPQVRAGWGCSA
ncbi:unnamed protein product [Coccothraustes coccothraustes]